MHIRHKVLLGFLSATVIAIAVGFYARGLADYGGLGSEGFLFLLLIWASIISLAIAGRIVERREEARGSRPVRVWSPPVNTTPTTEKGQPQSTQKNLPRSRTLKIPSSGPA